MWKVEFYGMGDTEPFHTWTVTTDSFVEARAVSLGRLGKALGSPCILLGAIRNGRHTVYLRGKEVGELKFTKGK